MLIDTHCHLYLKEFATDIENVVNRAVQQQVQKFYLPAIDSETNDDLLALELKYPNRCFAMMGLHPCSVKSNYGDIIVFHDSEKAFERMSYALPRVLTHFSNKQFEFKKII